MNTGNLIFATESGVFIRLPRGKVCMYEKYKKSNTRRSNKKQR
jgi:hypothetical protein